MGRIERWHLAEEVIVWIALLAALVVVAYYVIVRVRPKPAKKEPRASELLSNCRQSYCRGELSDEEFRTIKSTLADQVKDEAQANSGESEREKTGSQ